MRAIDDLRLPVTKPTAPLTELAVTTSARSSVGQRRTPAATHVRKPVATERSTLMITGDARDEVLVLYRAFGLDETGESWKEGEDHRAGAGFRAESCVERAIAALREPVTRTSALAAAVAAQLPRGPPAGVENMHGGRSQFPRPIYHKRGWASWMTATSCATRRVPECRAVRERSRSRSRGFAWMIIDARAQARCGSPFARTFAHKGRGICAVIG